MQGVQIGNLDLRVLAGVLRKVTRVERNIVQEVGIADQCLLINLPSHTNIIVRGSQHVGTMCFDSCRVIDIIHANGQFDIAATISTRHVKRITKRLMTLDVELALQMTRSLLPYSLINMLHANLPQMLLPLRRIR